MIPALKLLQSNFKRENRVSMLVRNAKAVLLGF
jgi:hypothetical protein